MNKIVSLLLVFCFCVGLAACGKSSPSPSADAAPMQSAAPAETAAPTAEPTPEPTPEPLDIQALVDSLNAEEVSQRTEEDPYIAVFEVAEEENTIHYKFAMNYFGYVVLQAEAGDAENISAYNRILDSLPGIENSLENMLRDSGLDVNMVVLVMVDEVSSDVAAVIDNGGIVYDRVNGVGTAPTGITPIFSDEDIPEEMKQQLEEYKRMLAENGVDISGLE